MKPDSEILFHYRRADFIKSLNDGLDIDRTAAEYLISYSNLDNVPTDGLSIICKSAADNLMLLKEIEDVEETQITPEEIGTKGASPTARLLYGMKAGSSISEPTNHPWKNRLGTLKERGLRRAAWPHAVNDFSTSYSDMHPFHESIHPLLERNSVTGKPTFVQMLEDFYLPEKPGLKSRSESRHDKDLQFHAHHVKEKNPVVIGYKSHHDETSKYGKFHYGGPLKLNKAIDGTNQALYQRDFDRWLKDNEEVEIDLLSKGLKGDELDYELRKRHFNNRASDWVKDDIIYDDAGNVHGTGLGWFDYTHGLEWLNPQERTTVLNHLFDKGSDTIEKQRVELPDGTMIPIGRFAADFARRSMPEMNWFSRLQNMHGPNMHTRKETNEKDYTTGENRFTQLGLSYSSREPKYQDGSSIVDNILEQIHSLHPKFGKEEEIENMIENLPRLNLHLKGASIPDKLDWNDAKKAEKKHFSKKGNIDSNRTLLSKEDLYFLAGYHPKTLEHLPVHPLYGKLEEPIIPLEDIQDAIDKGNQYTGINKLHKNIRHAHQYNRAAFGPRPEDVEEDFWTKDSSGDFTKGAGSYWWQPFMNKGGLGRASNTYREFIHALLSGDDEHSPLGHLEQGKGERLSPNWEPSKEGSIIMNNENNMFYGHIAPMQVDSDIYTVAESGKKKKDLSPKPVPIQYVLHPYDTHLVRHDSDGNLISRGSPSDKHNFTEHMSSLSGKYSNYGLTMSQKELKNLLQGKNEEFHLSGPPMSNTPFRANLQPYGEEISDNALRHQAVISHILATVLGRRTSFENPQQKAILGLNDINSDNISTMDSLQDYLDFIGWSPRKSTGIGIGDDFITNPVEANERNVINTVAKELGNDNPIAIARFLHNHDFTDFNNNDQEILRSYMKSREEDSLEDLAHGIKENLKLGTYRPPMEEELRLMEELETLQNDMILAEQYRQFGGQKAEGEMIGQGEIPSDISIEELNSMRNRMNDIKSQLSQIQGAASSIQPKSSKQNNWWKLGIKNTERKLKADMKSITEAAMILKPMIEESQPDAFDPSDKMKFLHNSAQLMRMANRWLLTAPHEAHGVKGLNYAINYEEQEQKKSNMDFYTNMVNILGEHGKIIDGGMSVDEALDELGLESTPEHKTHVRQLIDQSNETNSPLSVLSMHELLTNGEVDKILGKGIANLHGINLHDEVKDAQAKATNKSDWKTHEIHAIPKHIKRNFSEQLYAQSLADNGLNMIHSEIRPESGKAVGDKKKPTHKTQNLLDSLLVLNPQSLEESTEDIPIETIASAGWTEGLPISAPNPEGYHIMDLHDSGRMDWGQMAYPTFGVEFDGSGKPMIGDNVDPTLLHSVSEDILNQLHGADNVSIAMAGEGVTPQPGYQMRMVDYEDMPASDETTIATGEMSEYIQSLLNPDILLSKGKNNNWSPPIRPMHRIFSLDDMKHLKGFSDSWVVSKWYDGKRLIISTIDGLEIFNENGKKAGMPKTMKESIEKINDKKYIIDTVMHEDGLYVIDILNYDDSDVTDLNTNERLKILRGQFESHDNVFLPGPYNTRVTDEEGLDAAISDLDEDNEKVLLRDAKSTYMKGERRHPKWIIHRNNKDLNFIILDVRGKGPYTYRLGAGPINHGGELGNRAIEIDGRTYMDVGTAHKVEKPFKEGDIVEGKVSGVTRKTRGGRDIYNVQVNEITGEGHGEGPASTESLSLFTKSLPPILQPHDIDYDGRVLKILLNDVDIVEYEIYTSPSLNGWSTLNPIAQMGELSKSQYPIQLAESLRPFWSPVAALMIEGHLTKMAYSDSDEEEQAERIEEESAGVLNQKEKNILLKPKMVKALEVVLRALDTIAKERMTWTGPKGLGIDFGTPMESPRGPTKLKDESTLPDYDMRPRPGEDPEKPMLANKKGKHKLEHAKLQTDEAESFDFDIENGEPVISYK